VVDTFHGLLHPAESDYQYTDVQYSVKLFTGISKRSGWAFGNCCIRGKQRFFDICHPCVRDVRSFGRHPGFARGKFFAVPPVPASFSFGGSLHESFAISLWSCCRPVVCRWLARRRGFLAIIVVRLILAVRHRKVLAAASLSPVVPSSRHAALSPTAAPRPAARPTPASSTATSMPTSTSVRRAAAKSRPTRRSSIRRARRPARRWPFRSACRPAARAAPVRPRGARCSVAAR